MMKRKINPVVFILLLLGVSHTNVKADRFHYSQIRKKWEAPALRSSGKEIPSGQPGLQSQLNLPRAGDLLVKRQVNLPGPGEKGMGVIWDFSRMEVRNEGHEVRYANYPDAPIAELENSSIRSFTASGDSLLVWGYENPSVKIRYEKPEIAMVFPFSYGSENIDYYYGKGKYCDRIKLDVTGISDSQADGQGILILPGNDTIRNVLRVHTMRRIRLDASPVEAGSGAGLNASVSIDRNNVGAYLDGNDTTFIQTETYRWYAQGSRYPVLETTDSWWELKGKTTDILREEYVFHPVDQENELPEDKPNLTVLKENPATTGKRSVTTSFTCRTYPNPVTNSLQVEVISGQPSQIELYLYNMQGQLLYKKKEAAQQDYYHETISMDGIPSGNYLLRVQAGDKSEQKIIVKQ